MAGNPYDWGLDKVADKMTSISDSISRDRMLNEEANSRRITDQRNLFAMEKERKHEELLDKDVMWGTMIRAKGGSEKAAQASIEYAKSLGVGDDLGKVKFRNMPFLLKTMDDDKEYKIRMHDINDADLAEAEAGIKDEIKKIEENQYTNPEKYAKDAEILPQKIRMADQLKARRAGIQAQKNELLGLKADTSITETDILKRPDTDKEKQDLLSGIKQKEGLKPAKYSPFGYGQQRNDATGEIVPVPVAPREGRDPAVAENRDLIRQMQQENNFRAAYAPIQTKVDKVVATYEASEKEPKDVEAYDREIKRIKESSAQVLDPYRKYGLWNGWSTEPTAEYQAWAAGEEAKKKPAKAQAQPKPVKIDLSKGATWNGTTMVPNR
jgi:hypothetical protein